MINLEEIENIILENIKICPDCHKEFLAIGLYAGEDPAHEHLTQADISLYPLECGKCPDCAEKCFDEYNDNRHSKYESGVYCEFMEENYVLCRAFFHHSYSDTGNQLIDLIKFFKDEKEENPDWFMQCKELETKVLEKNKQIKELNRKIEELEREISLEQSNKRG